MIYQDSVLCCVNSQSAYQLDTMTDVYIRSTDKEINRYACSSTHQWLERGWEDSHNISSVSILFRGAVVRKHLLLVAAVNPEHAASHLSPTAVIRPSERHICPCTQWRVLSQSLLSNFSVRLGRREKDSPSPAPHGSCMSRCIHLWGGVALFVLQDRTNRTN